MNIKIYKLTQSDIDVDLDGNTIVHKDAIGMYRVAETNNPAIQSMGFSFDNDDAKETLRTIVFQLLFFFLYI